MKVIDIRTRTVLDVEACYGARLIGQGRAVLAPAPAEPAKEPEKAEEPEVSKTEEAPPKAKAKAKKG